MRVILAAVFCAVCMLGSFILGELTMARYYQRRDNDLVLTQIIQEREADELIREQRIYERRIDKV